MTTQPKPGPDPNCPDECECGTGAGCGGDSCPVDFGTGAVEVASSYLRTPQEGNFRLTWYNRWNNDGVPASFFGNAGENWSLDAFAYMARTPAGELLFVWSPGRWGRSVWFNQSGSTYMAKFGARQTLTRDGNTWRVTDPNGAVWEFSAIDELISKMITPGGQVTEYIKESARVVEKRRTVDDEVESRVFAYNNDGNVGTVTLYRGTTADPHAMAVRRVVFAYYTAIETNKGRPGDLKTVTTQAPQGVSGWDDVETRYYRYYTSDSSVGYAGALKYAVGPTAYESVANPEGATDPQIAAVAERAYEYDVATRRATRAATHGGSQVFTIQYAESGNTHAYNHWQLKAVATMPDGSTKTVFANHLGQDMLLDHVQSGVGRWIHYTQYSELNGRITQKAMPSAINMSGTPYNELSADLSVQLNPSKGLIQLTTYYGSSATAPGYPEFQQVKEGSSGSPINVSKLEYEEHTVGSGFTSATVYPVKKRISYRSDASGGSDPVETSYTNTFYAGKTQLKQVTEHLPDIDSGQNGGAWLTGNTREQHFDVQGRLEKSVDARSTVTTYAYDDATGTLSQMVQDPTGLNLVTDYQLDGMGRTIQTLGPPHNVNGQTVRTVQWTVYLDDEHEVRTAGGYLIGASSYTLVNPVSITRSDDSGRVTDEIQATRGTGVESSGALTAADSFPQSSWTRWTHHTYGVAGRLESTDVYHDIPASGSGASGTNYDRTEFAYDAMGRQNRVKSPSGTITRMVYDPRGLVLATWVGTNDAGATDGDPSGGGATGNNMRPVTLNTYDTDAYGSGNDSLDGLLTKTASPVDATTANDREVEFTYDWGDRRTTTVTTDGTNTFYAVSTLDNLGRSTAEEQKRGTTLIGKSETFYDDRGQTYQTKRWGVNDSGATTNALTDNTWYDAAGNVLKSLPAGSQAFTKSTYDAIGRQVASYTGYYDGAGDDSPLNLVDNLIFEQATTTYDAASNVTQTASLARYHDGSGTGALVAGTNARPAYTALYYDGIGRSVASAEYGNQGSDSVSFSRPASAPSSSDTILVSQTAYNARGEAQDQTDPAGQVTRTTYDDAGRVTSVVQNHGSTPTEQVDTTYAAGGQVQTLTAINSTTGNQVTSYAYGVTLSDSEIASGDLLDSVTYPDSGVVSYMYNRQGQRTQMTDQNGSVHDYVYDPLGRQAADKVTLASGSSVDDGVLRTEWTYDNRQRLKKITSYSAASGGSVVCDVEYAYNSFSQVTTEYQQHGAAVNTLNSPKIVYAYADGSINTVRRTSTTHPDGTVLNYGYGSGSGDKLSRVEKLAWDSTDVVEYAYLGLGQVVIQTYVQPTDDVVYTLDSGTANAYAGLDRFGRIVDLQWEQP